MRGRGREIEPSRRAYFAGVSSTCSSFMHARVSFAARATLREEKYLMASAVKVIVYTNLKGGVVH